MLQAFSSKFAQIIKFILSKSEEIEHIIFPKLVIDVADISAKDELFGIINVDNIADVIDDIDRDGLIQKMLLKIIKAHKAE